MSTTSTRPLAKGEEELIHRGLSADMLLNYQPDPHAVLAGEILKLSRNGKSAVKIVSHLQKDYPGLTLSDVYGTIRNGQAV